MDEATEKRTKDRKFKLVLISMLSIFIGFAISVFSPALATIFPTYVGSIIALNLVYGGHNLGSKYIYGKVNDLTKG